MITKGKIMKENLLLLKDLLEPYLQIFDFINKICVY